MGAVQCLEGFEGQRASLLGHLRRDPRRNMHLRLALGVLGVVVVKLTLKAKLANDAGL
jgi:hypothetical protein